MTVLCAVVTISGLYYTTVFLRCNVQIRLGAHQEKAAVPEQMTSPDAGSAGQYEKRKEWFGRLVCKE